MIDLKFLGCGSGYNPDMNNTNEFFLIGDHFYLVDCGFTTFQNVIRLEEFKKARSVTVFLTHLHADHAGSLPMFVSYCFNIKEVLCSIVFPLNTVNEYLLLTGIPGEEYEYHPNWNDSMGDGKLIVEAFEVEHTPLMKCFAYTFSYENSTIYISGDSSKIPERVLDRFNEGKIDRIYQDTMYCEGPHPAHGTLQMLNNTFTPGQRNRVFCIHYNKDFRSAIRENGYGVIYDYFGE